MYITAAAAAANQLQSVDGAGEAERFWDGFSAAAAATTTLGNLLVESIMLQTAYA